jgi:hypothetical protein
MVDIKASSHVDENLDIPWATFLYTVSLMPLHDRVAVRRR